MNKYVLFAQALEILQLDPEQQIMQISAVAHKLAQATLPQNRSLLPNDLQATTKILFYVIKVLENNNTTVTDTVGHSFFVLH